MYADVMRRFQILLDDALDDALEREARRRGTSKADILRLAAGAYLRPLDPASADPLFQMVGRDDYAPADVDEVVYG